MIYRHYLQHVSLVTSIDGLCGGGVLDTSVQKHGVLDQTQLTWFQPVYWVPVDDLFHRSLGTVWDNVLLHVEVRLKEGVLAFDLMWFSDVVHSYPRLDSPVLQLSVTSPVLPKHVQLHYFWYSISLRFFRPDQLPLFLYLVCRSLLVSVALSSSPPLFGSGFDGTKSDERRRLRSGERTSRTDFMCHCRRQKLK